MNTMLNEQLEQNMKMKGLPTKADVTKARSLGNAR